jgi:hypothetical protein
VREDRLFEVHDRAKDSDVRDETSITVKFAGRDCAVSIDPTGQNRSGQVLRVLTQIVALNRSAKDFPAPAVVPIIAR